MIPFAEDYMQAAKVYLHRGKQALAKSDAPLLLSEARAPLSPIDHPRSTSRIKTTSKEVL